MKRRHTITWGVIVTLFAAVVALLALPTRSAKTEAGEVPLARVERGDLDLKVHTTGELRADQAIMLSAPPVGGGALQITRLLATGTPVKKGDLVFEFDPSEQNFKLEQNRSELLEAEQEIIKARADVAVQTAQDKVALLKARFEVRRAELEVQKNELVSAIDGKKNQLALEQAKRSLAKLEQDIESHTASGQAEIALAQEKKNKAKLAMDQAQQNIGKMRVAAPMDGLVAIEKNRGEMEMMWSGMSIPDFRAGDQAQPGTAVAQVINPRQMQLAAKIGEHARDSIKVGQSAEIRFDAIPDQLLRGTVKTVGGMSVRQFWETDMEGKFEVSLQLATDDARLRPGLTAQIVILAERRKDVLHVPRQALFLKDGKNVAYVKTGSGFEQHDVKVQCESASRAAIEGLKVNDEVALVDPTVARRSLNPGAAPEMSGGPR